jgi:hypothetical protein
MTAAMNEDATCDSQIKHTSSYNPTFWAPMSFKPNHRMAAVIPLPQVVMTALLPSIISFATLAPSRSRRASRTSKGFKRVVYDADGVLCVSTKCVYGSGNELGMWPEGRPGRGSGSEPRYLRLFRIMTARLIRYQLTDRANEHPTQSRQLCLWRRPNASWIQFARSLVQIEITTAEVELGAAYVLAIASTSIVGVGYSDSFAS